MNDGKPAMTISDVPERSRYEARIDGTDQVAIAAYTNRGSERVFTHTEVPESLEGRGVGGALVKYALEDTRKQGLTIVPDCPFVASYIRKHPEIANT